MKKTNKFIYAILVAALTIVGACSTDDLKPSLEQSKEGNEALATVGDMEGLIKGAYNRMSSAAYYGRDYFVTNEVRTPNAFSNGNSGRFVTQAEFAYLPSGTFFWDEAYGVIAIANILINADIATLEGDQEYAKHIQGQAYAIRALAHFDLLKTFGQEHTEGTLGVPYMTEFKGEDNIPSRPTIEENESMIMSDFQTAFDMMSEDYFDASKEFMSKYTAPALESRAAVYFEMWPEAIAAAELVINSGKYSIVDADNFISSFAVDGAANSLFEIALSGTDNQGSDSMEYIYRGESYGDIEAAPNVLNLYGDSDVRLDVLGMDGEMIRNMAKYPDREANIPVIRYEEVILNYAEALHRSSTDDAEALVQLNRIPENRNADSYGAISLDNILEERRKEFIFEGNYYWDLLRNGMGIEKVDAQQNVKEDVLYGDYRLAYPIPLIELDANSNMEQNPGY